MKIDPVSKARQAAQSDNERVALFWQLWPVYVEDIQNLLSMGRGKEASNLVGQICQRMTAGLGGVRWDLEENALGGYKLSLRHNGAETRALVSKWAREAPQDDEIWSFYRGIQPSGRKEEALITASGEALVFGEVRLNILENRTQTALLVEVYHPAFSHFAETEQREIALLILERAVGQELLEYWVAGLATTSVGQKDMVELDSLARSIADVRSRNINHETGGLKLLEFALETEKGAMLLQCAARLTPSILPEATVGVRASFDVQADEDGLPITDGREVGCKRLEEISMHISNCSAVVASEYSRGRQEVYVSADPETYDAESAIRQARQLGAKDIKIGFDPNWELIRHLTI